MASKTEAECSTSVNPSYTPLAMLLLKKKSRIGEDNGQNLIQKRYIEDIVTLCQTFNFTEKKIEQHRSRKKGRGRATQTRGHPAELHTLCVRQKV